MRLSRAALLLLALSLSWAQPASAGRQYSGAPDDFLRYGVGARALAMGGAFNAMADDVTAAYYNPAGLAMLHAYEVQFMHAPFFEDTTLNYAGLAVPVSPHLTFAISNVMLGSGEFEQRDASNQVVGTGKSVSDNAVLFSVATHYQRKYFFGVTGKMLSQSVFGHSGSAVGLDLGMMANVTNWLRVGAVIQNINSPSITLVQDADVYPVRWSIGTALHIPDSPFTWTTQLRADTSGNGLPAIISGGEMKVGKRFVLRGGLDNNQAPNFGFGTKLSPITLDYAFSPHELGSLHRFSFGIRFGNIYRTKVKPELPSGDSALILRAQRNEMRFVVERPKFPIRNWKFSILRPDGRRLWHHSNRGSLPAVIDWYLHDSFGRPVKAGRYNFKLEVRYVEGPSWTERGEVMVKEPPTRVPVRMKMNLSGLP